MGYKRSQVNRVLFIITLRNTDCASEYLTPVATFLFIGRYYNTHYKSHLLNYIIAFNDLAHNKTGQFFYIS